MDALAAARRVPRLRLWALDTVVALAVFALALSAAMTRTESGVTVGAVVLGAAMCAALVVRRRWPLPVLLLVTVGALTSMAAVEDINPFVLAVVVAVYTVGSCAGRGTAVVAGTGTALLLGGVAGWFDGVLWPEPHTVALVAWTLMAAAVGDAVRTRRAYVVGVEERARRAEETREAEARRQVAEERLRIARELHDAVAHHIAVANVQAGVASHLLTAEPAAAEEALGHIRRATRSVLEELAAMLTVLREPGDRGHPTEPAPGLAQVGDLVDGFGASGLRIRYSVTGRLREVAPTVGLVAYRIVQEALTNAHKHGAGQAVVTVVHAEAGLEIEVTNRRGPGQDADAAGLGHGLVGMRERAAAVGGELHAGPEPNGRYRVHATLPVEEAGRR